MLAPRIHSLVDRTQPFKKKALKYYDAICFLVRRMRSMIVDDDNKTVNRLLGQNELIKQTKQRQHQGLKSGTHTSSVFLSVNDYFADGRSIDSSNLPKLRTSNSHAKQMYLLYNNTEELIDRDANKRG